MKGTKGKNPATPLFSREEYEWIGQHTMGKHYWEIQTMIHEHFGKLLTMSQVKGMMARKHFLTGSTGCFPKGNVPYNKGKKMRPDIYNNPKVQQSWFKKGGKPWNTRPDWYEEFRSDGTVYIKVPGRRKMVLKARWVWEQANGKIPPKHCIVHLDGDACNNELSNLRCIPQAANSIKNHIYKHDGVSAEGNNAQYTLAEIKATLHRMKRGESIEKKKRQNKTIL